MKHTYLSASFTAICFFFILAGHAQPWSYQFGTGTSTFSTANTSNLNFLPQPVTGAGTDRVYIGTGGGSIKLSDPGIAMIGTKTEFNLIASTSATSVNKAAIYDYTGGTAFYTRFDVLFGTSTGANTAASGDIYFFQGNGNCFSDNNDYSSSQVFTGIKFTFAASGVITPNYLNGATWTAFGTNPFNQGNTFIVEIFGNNSTATINYTYNGVAQTLAPNTQDIWVNTVNIGNDLAKSQLANNTAVDSWMITGSNSTANAANIFIDDMTYSNSIASGYLSYLNYYSKPSLTLQLTSEWATNRNGIGTINPPNFSGNYRRYIIVNTTASISYNGSTLNCNSIGALWTVSGTDSRVVVGDENSDDQSIFYLQSGTKRLAGTIDVTNNGSLYIKNLTLPTFGNLAQSSVVVYDQVYSTGSVTVANASYGSLIFTGESTFNINGPVTVKDILEIDLLSGAVVVKAGKNLTVQGETIIYCPECLVLESTASGVASFIDNGMNYVGGMGSVKVQDYRVGAGGATPNGRFHYASIPVTSATSGVYDAAGGNKVWYFSEATAAYTEITNNTTALNVGKGYLIRLGANTTLNFTGNLNTGNITLNNLTANGPVSNRGFHLVGNPYPSTLDWTLTNKTHLDPTIWYRTVNLSGSMVFDTYNAENQQGTNNNGSGAVTKDIPPMQAFWVKVDVDGTTGSLGLTNAMRSHAQDALYVSGPTGLNRLKLKVDKEGQYDETILLFDNRAADGFEKWDSRKMFYTSGSSALIPQLFTVIPGQGNMAINSFEKLEETTVLPLGFRTNYSGEFTIIPDLSSFNAGTILQLEDTETDSMVDLRTQPSYTFTADSIQTASRFFLHFTPSDNHGYITYGDGQVPVPALDLQLKNQNGAVLENTVSAADGAFRFNQAEPGTNLIKIVEPVSPGAINAADALLAMKHFVNMSTLTGLSLKAADVNADGSVNAIDALLILKYFVGQQTEFPAGAWQMDTDSFILNAPGQQQTFNLKVICTGDVDQSYQP